MHAKKTAVDSLSRGGRSNSNPSKLDDKENHANVEEENEPSLSQQYPLSQTDEAIRQLERDGKINDVVGAESILSQELYAYRGDDGDGDNIHSSQVECETHTSMAKRLGLLSQGDEEDMNMMDGQGERKEKELATTASAAKQISPETTQTPMPSAAKSTTASTTMLRDTPIRESECFGSLLEAVQKITEQEDLDEIYSHIEQQEQQEQDIPDSAADDTPAAEEDKSRTKVSPRKRKTSPNDSKSKSKVSKRKKKMQEEQEAQERAKRAARLAEQTVADPEMAKKLLLSMALVRENPRSSPETWPPRGSIVGEGFFWAHYPPLEIGKDQYPIVLKKKMEKYYELSTTKCQSAQQQAFNNNLVVLVKDAASEQGWKFDNCFSDKSLRDRIRCYYKTHIQNAKKRLKTMIRNPTKRANAKHLCEHLDLIESHKEQRGSGGMQSDEDTAELSDADDEEDTDDDGDDQEEEKALPKSTSRQSRTRAKLVRTKR
eukprot:scaffold961_cov122-Cylindrotheca_fusiformis.AAC.35